ncbi:NAD-dependent epimerase/dehydratase family protein [Nonomuraea turcica]|uniref:NAD-dependent epimerase/dehydratase family protein n=1 Tax=Nonomuraea sp. G32 TaxID=3067274 RepID=UPI00273C9CEB|nr:NAD-dependent epimerase/dehydratase family protein [Nonomuraea sp. G32]MDP4505082.1 hypothetical protein [Nonomuraea sp. G32]
MRVLLLGGTWFLGRHVAERLVQRDDAILLAHRGSPRSSPAVPGEHLYGERRDLARHAARIKEFAPDAVVDTCAFTAADVDAVLPVLPEVPTVVLSSQDVYEAYTGLRCGRELSPLPLTEDSPLRRDRYPYRGAGHPDVPDDYDKLDVEERWLPRGAVVLRLPLIYGPYDWQRREEPILRRVRAGRARIPIGAANLLWTRCHVDDVATGVLAALDNRAVAGQAINLGETSTATIGTWFRQILSAAGSSAELVQVPDRALPHDLALSGAQAQHLLVSVTRAQSLLGWTAGDPAERVADSVRWHLAHAPADVWTDADTAADEAALA